MVAGLHSPAHLGHQLLEFPTVGRSGLLGRPGGNQGLQSGAGLRYLDGFGQRHPANRRSSVGLPDDQALLLQLHQSRANRSSTGIEHLGELQLDEALTRTQTAGHDLMSEPVGAAGVDGCFGHLGSDCSPGELSRILGDGGRAGRIIIDNTVHNHGREFPMKICMAGEGAIARKHLNAVERIEGVEVASLVGGVAADTEELAAERGIPYWTLDLAEGLSRPGVEAAILTTPTPLHAAQAIQTLEAGKHVLVEIPMADNLADSERLVEVARRSGKVAMVCHTRRFNPSHQWIHNRIEAGELKLQHLVVDTFFFRRQNMNALGKPRSWTDHLLWHHACHTVDLFQYQTGEIPSAVTALEGPHHRELGIAMDMSIGLKAAGSGALCTLALSFNNEGPLGTFFRYICDNGTYIARYDDLIDGNDNPVDLSGVAMSDDGIELQDREFFSAIDEGREPNSSVFQALDAMRTLDRLEKEMK